MRAVQKYLPARSIQRDIFGPAVVPSNQFFMHREDFIGKPKGHFQPGQFYRLQNFETSARTIRDTRLLMEGIALTGAWVDKENGLLSLIALELGVSSRLCAFLKPGEEVVVMGPTGTPTEIENSAAVSVTPCCSRLQKGCARREIA